MAGCRRTAAFLVVITCSVGVGGDRARPVPADPTAPVAGAMTVSDRINLEGNLRWLLQRERQRLACYLETAKNKVVPRERVGVLADAGAWHVGVKSIVASLEAQDVPCRVLDRSLLSAEGLKDLKALVLPGGWAPLQRLAAGDNGLAAVRAFVTRGGRCLAICAGAYLLSKTVKYEGAEYPYPVGLFDGVAEGPVQGLAPFPKVGRVRLRVTEAGRQRGLQALAKHDFYYSGGPCFHKGSKVTVFARFHDGSAAVIARRAGKGEVVLVGVHLERPAPAAGDDTAPPPKEAGRLFKALLFPEGPK